MGTVRKASNKKLGKRIQNILFRKQYLHKRRFEKVYIYKKNIKERKLAANGFKQYISKIYRRYSV